MSNLEKDLRKEFKNSAAHFGYHVVDIPDELKEVLHLVPPELASRIKPKPYDLGILSSAGFCAVELKKLKEKSFVPKDIMEMPHQWEGLKQVWDLGWWSGLLIQFKYGVKKPAEKVKYNLDTWLLNLTFWLPTAIIDIDHRYTLDECIDRHILVPRIENEKLLDLSKLWTPR